MTARRANAGRTPRYRLARHHQLLLGLGLGVLFGVLFHRYTEVAWINSLNTHLLQPVGQIFLRMIFMVVVPLVFSALVLGVYELGKGHGLGRVAAKTLLYTLIASSLSVVIGITLVNTLRPGSGFPLDPYKLAEQQSSLENLQKNVSQAKSFSQALVELIPKNPLESATQALNGEMLPLMVFALFFGLALSLIYRGQQSQKEQPVLITFLEQLFAVSMKIIDFAMAIAPIGVFAIVFNTLFKFGEGILTSLFFYVATVVAGLLLQQFVVYSILLKTVARRSPLQFFKACKDVYLYAFSTASSNATLPQSLLTAETKLGLSPRISRFVLTVGSTANQNGTALFEGITVLFLAQVYGVDLTLMQQAQVVLMSILAGIGTAGVPGGSLPLIMILLQSVGIPPEGIGLILGADRFLDMCRTTLNVSGDLVISALVDEKESRA